MKFLDIKADVVTTDQGNKVLIKIFNNTSQDIYVHWIDREGVKIHYGTLEPGHSYIQETAAGHAWQIGDHGGTQGFRFVAESVNGYLEIAPSGPYYSALSEYDISTPLGNWNAAEGFGLIDAAKSLGVDEGSFALPIGGKNNNIPLNLVQAPSAWKAGYTGEGVTVAVLDVGIAPGVEELAGSVIGAYDVANNDDDATPDPQDFYIDHPIATAVNIVGKHDFRSGPDVSGIAPDAKLLNVRTNYKDGGTTDQSMADGIRWAVDNGAKVLAIPQGSPNNFASDIVRAAVKYAFDHNVVTVFAGGNSGVYGASGPALLAKEGIAIAVGNYDLASGALFHSSNLAGDVPFAWVNAASTGYAPTITGEYAFHLDGGTSYATPYVAGLAALLFQQAPGATAKEVIDRIVSGAAGNVVELSSDENRVFRDHVTAQEFDGGAGLDRVIYAGARSAFTVKASGDVFTVTDKSTGTTDILKSIERLTFDDVSLALDIHLNEDAGSLTRLYQTSFGRTPDGNGLGFWLKQMDNGMALKTVAESFIASKEFASLYGGSVSEEAFITNLYANVLHRAPDQAGFEWHLNNLKTGVVSRSEQVINFSESAENVAQLIGIMGDGVEFLPHV